LISGTYNLVEGSLIQELRLGTISNNLANINTFGFKKDIVSFSDLPGVRYQSGTDFSPGPVIYTGNELDVALDTPGFFKIQTPRGIRYTRNGSFNLNIDGIIVDQKGDPVLGKKGKIKIDSGSAGVMRDGERVSIRNDGEVIGKNGTIDRILVVNFEDQKLLKKEGRSDYLYQGEETDEFQAENIGIKQRYLERANVHPTEEMIKMVEVFRAFESAQKAIQCMDEITSELVNDPGLLQ
jgi:flagellar basal-body rod protein FlgG